MNENDLIKSKITEPIPVYAYVRVSTKEQAMFGDSVNTQIDDLKYYAENNNMKIVDFYIDEGKSALKRLDKRDALQSLLKNIPKQKAKGIIFTKLDRWTRNSRDYWKVQDVLDEYNIFWKAIHERFETETSEGRFAVSNEIANSQRESEKRGERVKAVFDYKVRKGENIFSSTSLPIGFKISTDKRVVIDPNTVKYPLAFYEHYETYRNKNKAIRYMCETFDRNFNICNIRVWLTSTLMYGEYRDNKNYCEAIISKERFMHIKKLEKLNIKTVKNRYEFIFSGLVRCYYCGRRAGGKNNVQNGRNYPRYICGRYGQHIDCKNKYSVTERAIETYLLKNLDELIDKYIFEIETKEKKQRDYKKEIQKIKAKMERLNDLYLNLRIDESEYNQKYNDLQGKLDKYSSIPKKEEKQALIDFKALNIKEIYPTLTNIEKGVIWRSIIKDITWDENKNIHVIFL
ncbi:recombinase family protein [Anaerofustis stercorihominis]|uniref:recombinase family protein n=1 Tax=Anaerofustis stercorihominis TaxID=214853 RepID=UPI002673C03F|nr:recombinase family protein [Anaerofustis stercorihominis]